MLPTPSWGCSGVRVSGFRDSGLGLGLGGNRARGVKIRVGVRVRVRVRVYFETLSSFTVPPMTDALRSSMRRRPGIRVRGLEG